MRISSGVVIADTIPTRTLAVAFSTRYEVAAMGEKMLASGWAGLRPR
jgi:hypothetical protein